MSLEQVEVPMGHLWGVCMLAFGNILGVPEGACGHPSLGQVTSQE